SPPQITAQPNNVTVQEPATASFSVQASGTAPLAYQWRRGGAPINGATGPSYSLNTTSRASDNGAQFDVIVSNPFGAVTSRVATLTVQGSVPQITAQPADVTVQEPAAAAFSVQASGTAPLTYQWRRGGAAISGASTANRTVTT